MLSTPATTSDRILEAAADLIQTRGYNGFSYLDISNRVGIRKASVHHHFPTKGDLGQAVVRHFMIIYGGAMKTIEETHVSGLDRIMAFSGIARSMLDDSRICPCAMLATEIETLPDKIRDDLRRFYAQATGWLAGCVRQGQTDGSVAPIGDAEDTSQMVLSAVHGATITAHCLGDRAHFDGAMRQLRNSLTGRSPR